MLQGLFHSLFTYINIVQGTYVRSVDLQMQVRLCSYSYVTIEKALFIDLYSSPLIQILALPILGLALRFSNKANVKYLISKVSKFWRSGVPTRASSSRRISKLCNLSRVESIPISKMMNRGGVIRGRVEYGVKYRVDY